jgi:hypothetical protein
MEVIASEFPDLYQWFEAPMEVMRVVDVQAEAVFDIDMFSNRYCL